MNRIDTSQRKKGIRIAATVGFLMATAPALVLAQTTTNTPCFAS